MELYSKHRMHQRPHPMWAADLIYERCILSVSMDITLPSVFTLGVNRGGRVSAVLSSSRSELLKAEDIFLPCMHATIKCCISQILS